MDLIAFNKTNYKKDGFIRQQIRTRPASFRDGFVQLSDLMAFFRLRKQFAPFPRLASVRFTLRLQSNNVTLSELRVVLRRLPEGLYR